MSQSERPSSLLPHPAVARHYHKNERTIQRWVESPTLGFPKPIVINGRKYYREYELRDWEIATAAAAAVTRHNPHLDHARERAAQLRAEGKKKARVPPPPATRIGRLGWEE
jgi:hypothetical protein